MLALSAAAVYYIVLGFAMPCVVVAAYMLFVTLSVVWHIKQIDFRSRHDYCVLKALILTMVIDACRRSTHRSAVSGLATALFWAVMLAQHHIHTQQTLRLHMALLTESSSLWV